MMYLNKTFILVKKELKDALDVAYKAQTSNFVVFPQNEGLLSIKEINNQPVIGLLD